jgi:phosphoribosylpyrophosphate synthetase
MECKIKFFSPKLNLKGKIVGVVDDIIETGGTLLRFYEVLEKAGAKKIIVLATHGVSASGIAKVKKQYLKLYLTNTIKQKGANIDITELIFKTCLKLHCQKSSNSNTERINKNR